MNNYSFELAYTTFKTRRSISDVEYQRTRSGYQVFENTMIIFDIFGYISIFPRYKRKYDNSMSKHQCTSITLPSALVDIVRLSTYKEWNSTFLCSNFLFVREKRERYRRQNEKRA